MDEFVLPTVRAMKEMGCAVQGHPLLGLMITAQGPKLIEYNVRFGDPECQVLMLRLMSDLVPALIASRDGQLKNFDLRWYDDAALVVVMATNGYPGQLRQGLGDRAASMRRPRSTDVEIFHAGTKAEGGQHHRQRRTRARHLRHGQVGGRGAERAPMRRSTRSTGRSGFCRRDIGYLAIGREKRPRPDRRPCHQVQAR